MLKITVDQEPSIVTLKLEGRIAGPWAAEFDRVWQSLKSPLESRKLRLDLREVTQMDTEGQKCLAEILRTTDADIVTDSLLIEFYVQKAMEENQKNGKENDNEWTVRTRSRR